MPPSPPGCRAAAPPTSPPQPKSQHSIAYQWTGCWGLGCIPTHSIAMPDCSAWQPVAHESRCERGRCKSELRRNDTETEHKTAADMTCAARPTARHYMCCTCATRPTARAWNTSAHWQHIFTNATYAKHGHTCKTYADDNPCTHVSKMMYNVIKNGGWRDLCSTCAHELQYDLLCFFLTTRCALF